MFIDTHAHLVAPDFNDDRDEVIQRARGAGVESIIVPGTDVETSRLAIELAEKYDFIYACVGVHPHEASKATDSTLEEIEQLSQHHKVVAIGEIGLDYHYDFSPPEKQIEVFRKQIELAIRRKLPIVVHTRKSIPDAIQIISAAFENSGLQRDDQLLPSRGVFHCFTGDVAQAKQIINMGFFVSYPGIVTFKNSLATETAQKLGYNHLMLETDSPYLTPAPHRGKRNEPAHIRLIAQKIAELCDASVEDVARATRMNAKKLFLIGEAASGP